MNTETEKQNEPMTLQQLIEKKAKQLNTETEKQNEPMTLQQLIEKKAKKQMFAEYKKFTDFMGSNEFGKALRIKHEDDFIPLVGIYTMTPLFETGAENDMPIAKEITNLHELRKSITEKFIEDESLNLLKKIDGLSEYFGAEGF